MKQLCKVLVLKRFSEVVAAAVTAQQYSLVLKRMESEATLPGFESQLHHLLTPGPWASYSTPLCLGFLIYTTEVVTVPTMPGG